MDDRHKVRFLTVIWGERYVEEFCRVSLPSYLAPGNIPLLARETDFEVRIMTSSTSIEAFEREPAFAVLRAQCPVRFILIDDLVTTANYGVTLTLAYARGIRESGAEQVDTYFVFMNSDFILADGGGRTLARLFAEGRSCIMSASLRACAEVTLPQVEELIHLEGRTLSASPRDLVGLALQALHPTVIGKTVNQGFVTASTHNQIYWRVDRTTLLARNHLIFMLAIRPEAPLGPINSYCDYGFVPEMVPSGDIHVIGDSDQFFMLELQPTDQEKSFLRCGRTSIRSMARELGVWTTTEHRRVARSDVVFHAGDLPPALAGARRTAADFVDRLQRRMRPPVTHAKHVYWELGVRAWNLHRRIPGDTADPSLPAELVAAVGPASPSAPAAPQPAAAKRRVRPWATAGAWAKTASARLPTVLATLYLSAGKRFISLTGTFPTVAVWHPEYRVAELALAWARARRGASGRVLAVGMSGMILCEHLEKAIGARAMLPADLEEEGLGSVRYDTVLIHVRRADVRKAAACVAAAERCLSPGGTIALFIDHSEAASDPSNFTYELAHYVEQVLPASWLGYDIKARFVGGRLIRRLRFAETASRRRLWPTSIVHLPRFIASAIVWPLALGLIAIDNIVSGRPSAQCPSYCSAALILMKSVGSVAPTLAIAQERSAEVPPVLDRTAKDMA